MDNQRKKTLFRNQKLVNGVSSGGDRYDSSGMRRLEAESARRTRFALDVRALRYSQSLSTLGTGRENRKNGDSGEEMRDEAGMKFV